MPDRPKPEEPDWFSTVPVSRPVITPDAQIRDMGGFAWTESGLRVGLGDAGSEWLEELRRLRRDPDELDPRFDSTKGQTNRA